MNAPELDVEGWINSEPLALSNLKDKVILLDFWAYSCVNCIRTLPYMKELWDNYKTHNFVLIGIHTPEFEFEKNPIYVQAAVAKHKIRYPIAFDNEHKTWIAYGNRYWPRKALINHDREVVWEHIGEGGYKEMELQVVNALNKCGEKLELRSSMEELARREIVSPEIYCGSKRNKGLGSGGVCTTEGCKYIDPDKHEIDTIYLNGEWGQYEEFLNCESGYIVLRYRAKEVNAVMENNGVKVNVLIDGKPVPKEMEGYDVKDGEVNVFKADMYNLIKSDKVEEHELKLIPPKADRERSEASKYPVFEGLKIYAFTFG